MGGSPGVYIYIIYKNRYIYIDRCECYEEAQKARNGQEGHEGPTKTHEKLRRPTKAHEGPRRPRKGATNSDELGGPAGVLQKAAANAANVLRTLGLLLNQRGGPDLWAGAGAGAEAGGAGAKAGTGTGAGAGAGARGWGWGWGTHTSD